MKDNQSGFLSAAVGAVVLMLFVGLIFLQRTVVSNSAKTNSPSPQHSASVAEVKFTNNTKHLTVSPTPSPLINPSVKPSTTVMNTNYSSSPSLTPSPSNQTSVTPSPTPAPSGRYVKILTPNGGENYKIGDTVNISWEYNDLTQCVIIYVLEDGTKSSLFIPVNPSRKSYPLTLLSDYLGMIEQVKVKVEMSCYNADNNYAGDLSDNFFTIKK